MPLSSRPTPLVLSIDQEEGLVHLSLLPEDTGKPDVLPETLGLQLRPAGEEKKKNKKTTSVSKAATTKKKRAASESVQVTNSLRLLTLTFPSMLLFIKQ